MISTRIFVVLGSAFVAGCAPKPGPDDPPQTHVGTCTHFQNALRRLENVPNCELRTHDTLINGLAPAYPGNKA